MKKQIAAAILMASAAVFSFLFVTAGSIETVSTDVLNATVVGQVAEQEVYSIKNWYCEQTQTEQKCQGCRGIGGSDGRIDYYEKCDKDLTIKRNACVYAGEGVCNYVYVTECGASQKCRNRDCTNCTPQDICHIADCFES